MLGIHDRLGGLSRGLSVLVVAAVFAVVAPAQAVIEPGQQMAPMKMTDQHDKELAVDAKTKIVLFSRDQAGNKVVNKALEGTPATFLPERGAVYAADISGMPGIITKMFALPKMRGYPYSVLLDRDASLTKALPAKEGHVTLLRLNQLKVEKIDYYSESEALKQALGI